MADRPLDLSRPVMTRDGRKVRILCTDFLGRDGRPVVAAVETSPGIEEVFSYPPSGMALDAGEHWRDLVNVPTKRTVWLNVYPQSGLCGGVFDTKEAADLNHGDRIACIPIEIEY